MASASRAQAEAQPLEPGSQLEGEMTGGKKRKYTFRLAAQELASVVVEQRGVDLILRVIAADGTLLARVDEREGTQGNEQVAVLAEADGIYQLEIQASEEGEAGRYTVRLAEVRPATARDRLFVAAERALLDASRLLADRTSDSRRLGVKKYGEAVALFHQIGDRNREAFALAQTATVQGWMGETQAAQVNFNRALAMQRENNNRTGEARALTGLGQLMASAGEWQKALDYHHQALALRRAEDDRLGTMVSLDRLGEIYVGLGEWQKALDYYNQALAILGGAKSLRLQAKLLGDIGQVYEATGDRQKALEHYERALALRLKRNNQGGAARMLHRIGLLHASLGQFPAALDRYAEALEIQQTLGNIKAADTLTSIGETYYRMGEATKALDYLGKASSLRDAAAAATPDEALTRYWMGRVRYDQGDLEKALTEVEAAVNIVEKLRTQIASYELRASYFATVEAYYEFYVDLLMQLHARHPSAGYQEAALAASERGRARSLLELLREARADIRRGVDPGLLARELSLQRQLNEKAEEQSNAGTGRRAEGRAEQLAKELEGMTTEYLELEAQIRQQSPRYAALTRPQPLNLKEIQAQLDPQTLLVEYKLGEARSYLWAVTPSSINSFELPKRSDIEGAARHLYELLTERNRRADGETPEQRRARLERAESEYEAAAAVLSRMLLGPAVPLLGDKRLLVVGDGALFYIPFAALPAPDGPSSRAVGQKRENASHVGGETSGAALKALDYKRPLVVDHEVINLPSASALALLREDVAGREPRPKLVAVVADPVFDAADGRVRAAVNASLRRRDATAPQQTPASKEAEESFIQSGVDTGAVGPGNAIPRLLYSRREAASILASAPAGQSKAALDFGASRAVVMDGELSRYRYIHFATHGLLNSAHPELSGIVLSLVDERGRRQEGFLRLHEIYNLELPVDMVVLSACQTGLGKEIKGEGLVGLTRGFMYAGAARVTASLWKVDDAATAELMGRFYSAMLQRGVAPSAALRQAQVEMSAQRRWRSPYYWAAFTMQGDWR